MATEGRRLTRAQVLDWNEAWSFTDRACVAAALDAVPDGEYVVPPSGGYINVWVDARRALVVHPGYLVWPRGGSAAGLPPTLFPDLKVEGEEQWHELSTFRPHAGGSRADDPAPAVCPIHGLALPLTGVCDDCR